MPLLEFPDKTLEVGLRQAQYLVEKGIVNPTPSGTFRGKDSEAAMMAMIENPAIMECDFCKGTPVVMEYPCADFITARGRGETHGSIGSWMACKDCSTIIETGSTKDLVERASLVFFAAEPPDSAIEVAAVEIGLEGVYNSFFEHRVGPGRAV